MSSHFFSWHVFSLFCVCWTLNYLGACFAGTVRAVQEMPVRCSCCWILTVKVLTPLSHFWNVCIFFAAKKFLICMECRVWYWRRLGYSLNQKQHILLNYYILEKQTVKCTHTHRHKTTVLISCVWGFIPSHRASSDRVFPWNTDLLFPKRERWPLG